MTAQELATRSHEWLHDANLLHDAGRFESAIYLCGYAVEFALKARMCRHLNWQSYRDDLPGMRSHVLINLLSFTGLDRVNFDSDWNEVSDWTPEIRYGGSKGITSSKSSRIISAVEALLKEIL
jgi:hypothetical protein